MIADMHRHQATPEIEVPAELYGRLRLTAEELGGADFGRSALDVGGWNGLNVPVIRALGPTEVTVIDPASDQLHAAVERGIVGPDEAFDGTLQHYARQCAAPVDTAFVFNLMPRLSDNPEFLAALVGVVRSGGWIVLSAREPATALQFHDAMKRRHGEHVDLAGVARPARRVPARPTGPHGYIQFWRHG